MPLGCAGSVASSPLVARRFFSCLQINADLPEENKLSVNDFLVKAAALALRKVRLFVWVLMRTGAADLSLSLS